MREKTTKTPNQELLDMLIIQKECCDRDEAEMEKKSITCRVDYHFYEKLMAISSLTNEPITKMAQFLLVNGIEELCEYKGLTEDGILKPEFRMERMSKSKIDAKEAK